MSAVGGSANINGVLYQLLCTIGRACSAHLHAADVQDEDFKSIQLVIEPDGGGGDLQLASTNSRVVEQLKAKSKGGTWSLGKVIDDVLPDLYKALPKDLSNDKSTYRFVTEGSIGNWKAAYDLFRSEAFKRLAGNIATSLDSSDKKHKVGRKTHSDQSLFAYIVEKVTKEEAKEKVPLQDREQRVWHLLSRFEFADPLDSSRLIAKVNEVLRHHVDDLSEVDAKRRELCGFLLDSASQGEVRLTGEELLKRTGTPLYTFRGWDRLLERMRARLKSHLEKIQYDAAMDVRPHLVGDEWVVAISGEGGQGKSWQLASFASAVSEAGLLPVWVPSARNNRDATEYAAASLWNYGLERSSTLGLHGITKHREYACPDGESPWAVICIDDVNSFEEAEYLSGLDWAEWGVRCIFTTNVEIGNAVEERSIAARVPLSDFGTSELRQYLKLRGKAWESLVADVEQLIRRPILASVYATAVHNSSWCPENEYEVIEAFWNALKDPLDKGALRSLAYSAKEDGSAYPWPSEDILERNIPKETIQRLIDAGWMKDMGDGALALWHNRLLAWAFAAALAERTRTEKLSVDELGATLGECFAGTLNAGQVHLGYAPMDTLWLVYAPESGIKNKAELWRLVLALEESNGFGHNDEVLYRDLLGSLGTRVIPHLLARVRDSADYEGNPIPRLASISLERIGSTHRKDIAKVAAKSSVSANEAEKELGLRLVAKVPEESNVDTLWNMLKPTVQSEESVSRKYDALKLRQNAFRAALALDASWLNSAIPEYASETPLLVELAYTLTNLRCEGLDPIWASNKKLLLETIPPDKRRCLIGCIVRFRDAQELGCLRDWVSSKEEFVGPTALQALAFFEPEEACQELAKLGPKSIALHTASIGLTLLAQSSAPASVAIRKVLSSVTDNALLYGLIAKDHGDRLERETVDALIDLLDEGLVAFEKAEVSGTNPVMHGRLDIVEGLYGSVVLEALRERRGSDFEFRLTTYACSRADNSSGWVDHEYEKAHSILKRMAGEGYTRLVNTLLVAEARQSRMTGCEEAIVRPNEQTHRLLRDAAMSDVLWGTGSSAFPLVQQRAVDSLAGLGRNKDLIDAVIKWGEKISPYVSTLRKDSPPMDDSEFQAAMGLLERPKHPQYANAILALGQTGRTDLAGKLQEVFLASNCESDEAFKAMLALEDLIDDLAPIAQRIVAQYQSGKHKFATLKLALKAPDTLSLSDFWEMLPTGDELDDIDDRLLSYLVHREDAKEEAIERVRSVLGSNGRHRLWTFLDSASVLDPEHPEDRERLWARSRWPRGGFYTVGGKAAAIIRLAKSEPDAAYETALETLRRQDDDDRFDMPDVLLRLALENAVGDLCSGLSSVRDKKMCRAIGVSLRKHGTQEQAASLLEAALTDSDPHTRRSAAMVAGFLTESSIGPLVTARLQVESDWSVCMELLQAKRAIQREDEAVRIVGTLTEVQPEEAWGAIDCICHLVDPDIAAAGNDPVGLVAYLNSQCYAIVRYATKLLEKRVKEIEKELDSLHNRWDRD